jgi:hypothetical protein
MMYRALVSTSLLMISLLGVVTDPADLISGGLSIHLDQVDASSFILTQIHALVLSLFSP